MTVGEIPLRGVGALEHRDVGRLEFASGLLDRRQRVIEVGTRQCRHLGCARERRPGVHTAHPDEGV